MSDYTYNTSPTFSARDALPDTDPDKVVKGQDVEDQLLLIETAVATKYDSGNLASQAQAEAESSNTVLITPLRVANWADANAGIVGDLQALSDPNEDVLFGWDDSASVAKSCQLDSGLEINSLFDLRISTTGKRVPLKYVLTANDVGSPFGSTTPAATELVAGTLLANRRYLIKGKLIVLTTAQAGRLDFLASQTVQDVNVVWKAIELVDIVGGAAPSAVSFNNTAYFTTVGDNFDFGDTTSRYFLVEVEAWVYTHATNTSTITLRAGTRTAGGGTTLNKGSWLEFFLVENSFAS